MTHESTGPAEEMAELASVAEAGEPQGAEASRGPQAEQAPPTPEQLDEREARFTGPRKPMGPEQSGISETVPDQQ